MTIDIKEHMANKVKQKHVTAYNKMAKAMDGLTIGTILHITASFVKHVISNMDPVAQTDAAMRFYTMISNDEKETKQ